MLLEEIWKRGRDFLGVRYPIICGGMTWISNYDLVSAVGREGAFPVLAAGNTPPETFEAELDRCLAGLSHPFAVNLITIAPNYRLHYEIVQSRKVPFVVFAGSFPKRQDIAGMKRSGKKTLSFASEKTIADWQIRMGIDGLILEGSEAGGHIGYVSLIVLLQQVLFQLRDFPVFVAGGLASGRMMAHLLLMGAHGCQFGTRFVMSRECTAHDNFKKVFMRSRSREAVATPQYDSKLPVVAVRAIKNRAMENFGRLQLELLNQLDRGEISKMQAQHAVENYWVGSLRKAVVEGEVEQVSLMAGQSVGLISEIKPIRAIIEELISEAENELGRVGILFERR
jgi:enoyl-[acyl-carrier protein] reductase II